MTSTGATLTHVLSRRGCNENNASSGVPPPLRNLPSAGFPSSNGNSNSASTHFGNPNGQGATFTSPAIMNNRNPANIATPQVPFRGQCGQNILVVPTGDCSGNNPTGYPTPHSSGNPIIPRTLYPTQTYGGQRVVTGNPNTDELRRNIMDVYASYNVDAWETPCIKDFIMPGTNAKTEFTNDGKIIISGLNLKIPDLHYHLKKELHEQLNNTYKVMCSERTVLSSYLKGIIWIAGIAIGMLALIFLIMLIYKAFFCKKDE